MSATRTTSRRGMPGFTLIEVLVTLMFLALVLPALMEGISLSSNAADSARRRTEAADLGQSQLASLVATQQWDNGNLAGDFSSQGHADMHWQAVVQAWPGDANGVGIKEIDLTVAWTERGHQRLIVLSTLAYSSGTSL